MAVGARNAHPRRYGTLCAQRVRVRLFRRFYGQMYLFAGMKHRHVALTFTVVNPTKWTDPE